MHVSEMSVVGSWGGWLGWSGRVIYLWMDGWMDGWMDCIESWEFFNLFMLIAKCHAEAIS